MRKLPQVRLHWNKIMDSEKNFLNTEVGIESNTDKLINLQRRAVNLLQDMIKRSVERRESLKEQIKLIDASTEMPQEDKDGLKNDLVKQITEIIPKRIAEDQKFLQDAEKELKFALDVKAKIQSQKPPESKKIN